MVFLDNPIILKDGTFLTDHNSLLDFLSGIGFDVEQLRTMLCADLIDELNGYREDNRFYELQADHYYCALNDLSNEIDELADKLATGKGGTKANYAQRFKKLAEFYNQ